MIDGKNFHLWAEKGISYQKELLELVDEDTKAFNQIMDAFKLPKENESDIKKRNDAIQNRKKMQFYSI